MADNKCRHTKHGFKMGHDEGPQLRWPPPEYWAAYPRDDEINLFDLWLVLRRRWKTPAGVLVVCVLLGLAYSLVAPIRYRYSTAVQIGRVPPVARPGIADKPIAPVGQVVARINNSLIPRAVERLLPGGNSAADPAGLKLKASSPQNSSIVVIAGAGPAAQRDTYFDLLNAVTAMLLKEHASVSDAVHRAYQARLEKARIALEALNDPDLFRVKLAQQKRKIQAARDRDAQLEDQETLLKAQRRRLDVKQKLIESQVDRLQRNIDAVVHSQVAAAHEAGSASDAMTVLLLGNDVQRSRKRLAGLRTQLQVGLPNERAELDKALADNRRERTQQKSLMDLRAQELQKLKIEHRNKQATQAQTVRELEAQLARVHPTRVVLAPVRSAEPIGIGSRLILALSLLLGLLLGALAALAQEFVVRARRYEHASQFVEPFAEAPAEA